MFHLKMGSLLSKETKAFNNCFINYSMKPKVRPRISSWMERNFLYWVLVDAKDLNKVALVVQNIYIDEFPTVVFYGNNSNQEASLSECVKQFDAFVNNKEIAIDFDKNNVILNRWWKNYLATIPVSYDSYLNINKENKNG